MRKWLMPVIVMLTTAALSTPAVAQVACLEEIITRNVTGFGFTNGTITNGTVRVLDGGKGNANWSFQVPDCELVIAYAHWHKWAKCPGSPTACFRNASGETCIYIEDCEFDDNVSGSFCSGYEPANGTHHYFWRIYPTRGTNWLNLTGCSGSPPNTVYGKWVVLIMKNCSNPADRTHEGQWWHNWGLWDVYVGAPYKTYFYNAGNDPANYSLWTVQSHYDTGVNISWMDRNISYLQGNTWFDPAIFHVSKQNQKELWADWHHIPPDGSRYMYVYTATLAEEAPTPDLRVSAIAFIPETPRPNKDFTVNVIVENTGQAAANTFNVSLYINGSLFGNKSISGLNPGGNKTVSFGPVNLPYGCHNFTAIADPDDRTGDKNREDNTKTRFYHVGYVIIAHSNSDMDALVSESASGILPGNITKIGNTYYIQNFTGDYAIESCGGHGIWIEDVGASIVISNCTVHNCGWKAEDSLHMYGIYLKDLKFGSKRIKNCTVKNNSAKGIRIQNSTHVDITNCTITDNEDHGIEIYPRGLPGNQDSQFCNITNCIITENHYGIDLIGCNCTICSNTISNNSEYGIYVYGNNNDILLNRIANSSSYGIKLYDSSGNCIYGNDFIDNNKTNSWYPKHQAYDNMALNHWNSTVSDFVYNHSGTGSGHVSYMGNYWNNDTCIDANNDGICDSAYKIDGATAANDYYPLKYPWQNYTLMCGDVDASGKIKYTDVAKLKKHYNDPSYLICSNWAGDVDCSDKIKYTDVAKLKKHYNDPSYELKCCTGCSS